jgi:predicted RNA-binding protein with PIN domain
LRNALEATVLVAQQLDPVDIPQPLRRFKEFTKLPTKALPVVRKALDDDDEFRMRVRDVMDEDAVGTAGWLLLDRPEGWQAQLDALVATAKEEADEASASVEVRRLRKEVDKARSALSRAETSRDELRGTLERSRAELAEERAARRAAEDQIDQLAAQLDRVVADRASAVRNLKEIEARDAQRAARVRDLDERARRAEKALADARAEPPAEPVDEVEPPTSSPTSRPASVEGGVDFEALSQLVADASSAAQSLASALAKASEVLHTESEDPPAGAATASTRPRSRRTARPRRRPTPIALGVLDDSVEAARHLVSVPRMVLLVDGYNVTLRNYSGLDISLQRDRLISGLAALAARTGVRPVVVFDAAEAVHAAPPGQGRGVQVRFTPPGVEADDVVLAAVDEYPLDTPVTVASSDERVRHGARRRGANVVSSEQLAALL